MSYIDKIVLNGNTYNIGNNDSSSNGKYRELADHFEFTKLTCLQVHNDVEDGYIGYRFTENEIINFRINVRDFSIMGDNKEYKFVFYIVDPSLVPIFYLSYSIGNICLVTASNDNDIVFENIKAQFTTLSGSGTAEEGGATYNMLIGDSIYFNGQYNTEGTFIKTMQSDDGYVLSIVNHDGEYGQLKVGTPLFGNSAANKSYVDSKLSTLQSTIDNLNSSISALNSFKSKYESMLQVIYNG